jgi:hypothetical protein
MSRFCYNTFAAFRGIGQETGPIADMSARTPMGGGSFAAAYSTRCLPVKIGDSYERA